MQESRTTILRVVMAGALAAAVLAAPLSDRDARPRAEPSQARRASQPQVPETLTPETLTPETLAPETLALAEAGALPIHYTSPGSRPASSSACAGRSTQKRLTVESTAYSLRGEMANGRPVRDGAVAMNCVPLGTKYRILSGPLRGKVVAVEDRIRRGSEFDIWMRTGAAARKYGRRSINIELVHSPR